ncbi:MAG: RNA methyltransferase [Bacteroidales bacterium]|nr:RNA methyltransferase [Bacteroidales bacterium]
MRKLLNEELNRLTAEEFKKAKKNPLVIILDNVRSMNNIGSVFRSADAFLASKIYLCGITATPPHKDIHKTALGATETVEWVYFENTIDAIDEIKKEGYTVYAVEQAENSIGLNQLSLSENAKTAVVFGHEVRGVHQQVVNHCDAVLEIPQFGTKHSLNISVCAGIVIWELSKKLLSEK